MNIKNYYNSEASQKAYVWKTGLMSSEETIFSFISKNSTILDLWCWWGRTTIELHKKWFHDIIWIDFAENLILWAKNKFPEIKDKFMVWDATNLHEFSDNQFDVVFFSFNGIDYIPDRKSRLMAFFEIFRVLKSWGFFIFSSHNRYCLPINRNLLKTQMRNIFNISSEYWLTRQSFWDVSTYYSSEKWLEKDLVDIWFHKKLVVPNVPFLYPFFDTFPYYIFQK